MTTLACCFLILRVVWFLPEAKQQVLGNLANFAYDPINYDFLRNLKVLDLFLDHLAESDQVLQKFAICGLCNLCLGKFKVFYKTYFIV